MKYNISASSTWRNEGYKLPQHDIREDQRRKNTIKPQQVEQRSCSKRNENARCF